MAYARDPEPLFFCYECLCDDPAEPVAVRTIQGGFLKYHIPCCRIHVPRPLPYHCIGEFEVELEPEGSPVTERLVFHGISRAEEMRTSREVKRFPMELEYGELHRERGEDPPCGRFPRGLAPSGLLDERVDPGSECRCDQLGAEADAKDGRPCRTESRINAFSSLSYGKSCSSLTLIGPPMNRKWVALVGGTSPVS